MRSLYRQAHVASIYEVPKNWEKEHSELSSEAMICELDEESLGVNQRYNWNNELNHHYNLIYFNECLKSL